jgi:hypothetical protein
MPNIPKLQKSLAICKHLSGPNYDEYILRTQTRTLGVILPELWDTAICNMFLYKNLPQIKEASSKEWVCVRLSNMLNGLETVLSSYWWQYWTEGKGMDWCREEKAGWVSDRMGTMGSTLQHGLCMRNLMSWNHNKPWWDLWQVLIGCQWWVIQIAHMKGIWGP